MKIIITDSTNIDNKWHENEESSLHGRKINKLEKLKCYEK